MPLPRVPQKQKVKYKYAPATSATEDTLNNLVVVSPPLTSDEVETLSDLTSHRESGASSRTLVAAALWHVYQLLLATPDRQLLHQNQAEQRLIRVRESREAQTRQTQKTQPRYLLEQSSGLQPLVLLEGPSRPMHQM